MRPSNRTTILDAAARVIQRDGVTALTFDAVAEEAGLTRGGLLYHFPSREHLVRAVDEHLSAQWEEAMARALGKPSEGTTADERLASYVQVCAQDTSRAELVAMLDAASDPERTETWVDIAGRWAPEPTTTPASPAELRRLVARLAADGLWMNEALTHRPLGEDLRQQIADHIIATFAGPEHFTDPGE